jgi:hypothetical protein
MKSMCHKLRRISPAVADCNPAPSWSATASRIASSSTARSAGASISPHAKEARASSYQIPSQIALPQRQSASASAGRRRDSDARESSKSTHRQVRIHASIESSNWTRLRFCAPRGVDFSMARVPRARLPHRPTPPERHRRVPPVEDGDRRT